MRAFRIGDRRFPLFDGTGAARVGGRWNSPGHPVIYAAETFAGALLEMLVHSNLNHPPKRYALIEIAIPDEVTTERVIANQVPDWLAADMRASRRFGDAWIAEARSAVLFVPNVPTGGRERNVLLNPLHKDFEKITASKPEDIQWDERLFHG